MRSMLTKENLPSTLIGLVGWVSGLLFASLAFRFAIQGVQIDFIMLILSGLIFSSSLSAWFIHDARKVLHKLVYLAGLALSICCLVYGAFIFFQLADIEVHIRIFFTLMMLSLCFAMFANAMKLPAKTGITIILFWLNMVCVACLLVLVVVTHTGGHTSELIPSLQLYACFAAILSGLITQVVGHITSAHR